MMIYKINYTWILYDCACAKLFELKKFAKKFAKTSYPRKNNNNNIYYLHRRSYYN